MPDNNLNDESLSMKVIKGSKQVLSDLEQLAKQSVDKLIDMLDDDGDGEVTLDEYENVPLFVLDRSSRL